MSASFRTVWFLAFATASTLCAQVRSKKAEESADFPALVQQATAAYEGQRYGEAIERLRAAIAAAAEMMRGQILAAMPEAPEGFVAEPKKVDKDAAANPMLGALALAAGNTFEHAYKQKGANGSIRVTVAANSPMAPMMAMAFAAAAQSADKEVVTYGEHKALLEVKKKGENCELQILVAGKHLVAIVTRGFSEDQTLALFDQKFVDRMAALLGK